jgi:uncharacterized protein YlxP (DUF503 family)
MLVATCVIKLQLPGIQSLKAKRSIIKSIQKRLANEFNVAIAEVNYHDVWQTAEIGLATVGTDTAHLNGRLQKAVSWVEENRPDVYIDQYRIEFR